MLHPVPQVTGLLVLLVKVGDYILSPEIAVERKSLSDLRQSFISGRLYHQATAMTRHYATPVLLIEFQRDAAFVLHAEHDIGPDIEVGSRNSAGWLAWRFATFKLGAAGYLHLGCD